MASRDWNRAVKEVETLKKQAAQSGKAKAGPEDLARGPARGMTTRVGDARVVAALVGSGRPPDNLSAEMIDVLRPREQPTGLAVLLASEPRRQGQPRRRP